MANTMRSMRFLLLFVFILSMFSIIYNKSDMDIMREKCVATIRKRSFMHCFQDFDNEANKPKEERNMKALCCAGFFMESCALKIIERHCGQTIKNNAKQFIDKYRLPSKECIDYGTITCMITTNVIIGVAVGLTLVLLLVLSLIYWVIVMYSLNECNVLLDEVKTLWEVGKCLAKITPKLTTACVKSTDHQNAGFTEYTTQEVCNPTITAVITIPHTTDRMGADGITLSTHVQ
ncbi:unnamed protein product [Medioppia subpectinata]|uniref:Uncharacterized protein n=1 Tax=Medioppia subpectinata TaxID=1979941 RepID=A0A7R9LBG6_9ACAR|nr:unnamed protein product [Medioppia subpectinata]CAG2116943.1 unnamed protein product [Medioppia subpectinata]